MKNIFKLSILFCALVGTTTVFGQIDGLPANAEPGSCFVKCTTPDEFKEVTETIVTRPAYKELTIEPAVYKDVVETVVIKEATVRYDYVPAVYETVEVPYVSRERRTDLSINPATFSDDSERREVFPKVSHFEYMPFPDCASGNPEDCQALCWQEYPARYETIPVKRLASDASTSDVPVAEQTATYSKQVVKEPARYVEVEIPAVTKTITRRVVDTPARVVEKTIPEQTRTITKTELVKAGGVTVWEKVDCSLITPTILPVYYDLGSARLREDSKVVIDTTVYALMTEQPNISVQIGSHTDSRGSKSFNQNLSQKRAQAVVDYLVSKGISRNRLVARGYGETRLVNNCADGVTCTERDHQANRRTDFQIIER